MPHKVFFCRPSGKSRVKLSSYREGKCESGDFHSASIEVFYGPTEEAEKVYRDRSIGLGPEKCERCGFVFSEMDRSGCSIGATYVRDDTGEEFGHLSKAPIGACWDATWYSDGRRRGPDGRYLIVATPGGHWAIDSRASNCTMKDDDVHYCWVRHGCPEDGTLHVDKNGNTCQAGAGSIMCGSYHGFLHNGYLTDN